MPKKKQPKAGKPINKPTPKKESKKDLQDSDQKNAAETRLLKTPLVDEMQESYIDYAMSVIVARALPDVRDGLKPVHRRILYAMWSLGLRPGAKFRKSATVVGEVLGKYHPHGDVAVYDSMVRMAQDFSLRYPLVRGQGNFGSMDGDRAAAMRYTEAKLASISEQLLENIEKDTVDFVPNYDGSQQEPKVLPSRLPNLLVNGSVGIAVGMATNIPPHNINEIVDGTTHLIDNPNATVDDLMQFVTGPDFPTGATIFDKNEIKRAYATGKGSIVTKANAEIIEGKNEQYKIIVRDIPYQVNKASLVEKIADLVKDKRIEGIKDLRDESSEREGVRVVIELKKDAYPKKILNRLYQLTPLQETFHVNMLALVDGIQPRVLTLKMILEEHIKHQREVIKRRTEYDLKKAEDRAHILKGLKLALAKIDQIISTIKKSKDKEVAKINLIKKFTLSERQAVAILEMRLQQLANLERLRIEQELKEKLDLINELKGILSSAAKVNAIIKKELSDIKEKYGGERRTKVISHGVKSFTQEDLIPNEEVIVTLTQNGYIKSLAHDTFRTQDRGGKGVIGLTTKDEDFVTQFFTSSTHSDILFFTTQGRVFQLKAYEIPRGSRTSRGQAIVNFLQLGPDEKISVAMPLAELDTYKYLVMVTTNGFIKKVDIEDFKKVRRSGLIAIKLKKDDSLKWIKPSSGKDSIIVVTSHGQSIRTDEKQVRAMGRSAAGVRAIKIKGKDEIVGMDVIDKTLAEIGQLLIIMQNGYGKRTSVKQYKVQGRGGSGIKTAKITPKTGEIIAGSIVNSKALEEDMIIVSNKGQVIRFTMKSVPVLGRATQGVRLMKFKVAGDKVASVTII